MNEDVLNEIAVQLKRIADSLETMTAVPELHATPEQVKELEKALSKDPAVVLIEDSPGAHKSIVDAWNAELVPLGIPRINSIRNQRAKMVAARIKEYGEDAFYKCIEEVKQSSFLQGKTKKPWTGFSCDWLVCPGNFPKVLEGNYNDNRRMPEAVITTYESALPSSWIN